jgi:arsenate reductase (thioredoxin)
MRTYIFACIHNAGRSQMSAAFFNPRLACALSAGTQPAKHVHPVVVEVMREIGIDLSAALPQELTSQLLQGAQVLITMGCGDECPYIPGLRREDWPLPDPKGRSIDDVRAIRDTIRLRVLELLATEGLTAGGDTRS